MIKYKLTEYINGIERQVRTLSNTQLRKYLQRLGDNRNNHKNLLFHEDLISHKIEIKRVNIFYDE